MRIATDLVTRRTARNAVAPASGTQPSSSTSIASQVLPSRMLDISARNPTYGGPALAEPIPVGW